MKYTKLYLVVPCYNEQEVMKETNHKLVNKIFSTMEEGKISYDSGILYI